MKMSPSALAITFLACTLLAMTEGIPILQLRCRCTETTSKEFPEHKIMKLEIVPPGSYCKDMEVIATVKFKKEFTVCLNPKEKSVQKIIKRLKQEQ